MKPPTDSIKTPINLPDDPTIINELSITSLERNKFYHFLYNVSTDGLGQPIFIPIIVCRGKKKGPILGITSAIHGNEINGVPLIHKLMAFIDPNILIGTVVAIPVFNGPGFLKKQKNFIDGVDLNTIFPGKPNGTPSQVYVYRMFENIIKQVEYLIDLHTAGFGEINSLFAFANMKDGLTSRLALLQSPQIIIHEKSETNTLRGACNKAGIKSITLGIGNPLSFQKKYVKHALIGVQNIMGFLKMIPYASIKENLITAPPTLCTSAFWMYTDVGGVLTVFPEVNVWVKKGEVVARVRDLFGNVVREYKAPCDGIVIGKNSNPPNQSGEKILYLGLSEDPKKFQ